MQTPIVISEPTSFSFMLQDRLLTSFDQFDRLVVFYLFVCFSLHLLSHTSSSSFILLHLFHTSYCVFIFIFKFVSLYHLSGCVSSYPLYSYSSCYFYLVSKSFPCCLSRSSSYLIFTYNYLSGCVSTCPLYSLSSLFTHSLPMFLLLPF